MTFDVESPLQRGGGFSATLGRWLHGWALWLAPELRPPDVAQLAAKVPSFVPPPPPERDLDELAQQLEFLLEAARAEAVERIRGVNETTERETLAAGEALQTIVGTARTQADQSRRTLERLSGGEGNEGVPELAAKQSASVQQFLAEIERIIHAHDSTMAKANAYTENIATAGGHVQRVAFQARLLSMNAAIEAARLGGVGGAFGVIAEEMTRLSAEIDAANKQIASLAEQLLEYLPQAIEQSNGLRQVASEFSGKMARDLQQLQQSSADFEQQVSAALRGGDETIGQIVGHTQAALSHLAFQDACAQRLLSVDAVFRVTLDAATRGVHDPDAISQDISFVSAQRNDAFNAGEVVALQDGSTPEGGAASGEVLLF